MHLRFLLFLSIIGCFFSTEAMRQKQSIHARLQQKLNDKKALKQVEPTTNFTPQVSLDTFENQCLYHQASMTVLLYQDYLLKNIRALNINAKQAIITPNASLSCTRVDVDPEDKNYVYFGLRDHTQIVTQEAREFLQQYATLFTTKPSIGTIEYYVRSQVAELIEHHKQTQNTEIQELLKLLAHNRSEIIRQQESNAKQKKYLAIDKEAHTLIRQYHSYAGTPAYIYQLSIFFANHSSGKTLLKFQTIDELLADYYKHIAEIVKDYAKNYQQLHEKITQKKATSGKKAQKKLNRYLRVLALDKNREMPFIPQELDGSVIDTI